VLLALGMMAVTAFAIEGEGGVKLTGKHYNLQILGKDKDDMPVGDTENRHTIFVPLNKACKIYMQQTEDPNDDEFKVLDANGFDSNGCRFELAAGHYNVFARALARPGGKTTIEAWFSLKEGYATPPPAILDAEGYQLYSLGTVDLSRDGKKPQVVNINKLFYWTITICEVDEFGNLVNCVDYTNYWVFDIEEIDEYLWKYNNEGLKLLQVRFYPCQLLGVDTNDPNAENLCVDELGNPLVASKSGGGSAPAKSDTVATTWGDIKE
jgi:hypothetical protein